MALEAHGDQLIGDELVSVTRFDSASSFHHTGLYLTTSQILQFSLVFSSGLQTLEKKAIKAKHGRKLNWEINCALTKSRGKWRIIEVGNIYPD